METALQAVVACSKPKNGGGGGGGGGGFFVACEDLGRMFDHAFPVCVVVVVLGSGD